MVHHYKPECFFEEKMDYCIQGHSERSKYQCFPRWYLLNCQTLCYQTWCCDASSWAGMSCKKIGLLFSRSGSQQGKPFSRSRSQQGLIWSKYDSFHYKCTRWFFHHFIFWTADSFATKLGLIVDYDHQPDCLMEKLDCVQGQGPTQNLKMSVNVRADDTFLLLPNLVWWCVIMSQIDFQKRLVCCLQDQGHGKE